jgi:H+/gluconate symporter-like permease
VSKSGVANFLHALAAVMAGNAAYFLLLPHLPPPAQHVTFRLDLGLVVDFGFCLIALGLIKMIAKWKRRKSGFRSQ